MPSDASRSASARNDARALAEAAHSLKGSSLNLGAFALAEACQALEEDANGGPIERAAVRVRQVHAEYARLISFIRTIADRAA